ncbi:hypothetical protein BKA82DRAFT_4080781 [Pisolithus tinctorius]|nr:hypothetical protein BKA82DRAFT_4080781 [Pisolithus tinctorius]
MYFHFVYSVNFCQLHIQLACLLFTLLRHHPRPRIVEQIINEAVQLENELLSDAVPVNTLGINPKVMSELVQFLADDLLLS